jgi:hypothetical protein
MAVCVSRNEEKLEKVVDSHRSFISRWSCSGWQRWICLLMALSSRFTELICDDKDMSWSTPTTSESSSCSSTWWKASPMVKYLHHHPRHRECQIRLPSCCGRPPVRSDSPGQRPTGRTRCGP